MNSNDITSLQITGHGRQDCSDMHSFGPIARLVYIIHYVIKGAGFLEYDHKTFPIKAGESFLICPYEIYYYYPDPDDPWEYTWIDFRGSMAETLLADCCMSKQRPVCPAIENGKMLPLFDRLSTLDIYRSNQKEAHGVLLAILGLYADFYPAMSNNLPAKEDNRLAAAVILIQANYHYTTFNVEELCNRMHCNRITLYRLFRNALNLSPSQYLIQYRLQQACKMLTQGIPVKTTALSCGFADQFYFSRIFRQTLGCSPTEYKLQADRQS